MLPWFPGSGAFVDADTAVAAPDTLARVTEDQRLTNDGEVTVASPDTLARDTSEREFATEQWQEVIDRKLVDWGRNPQQLEYEELIPPTRFAIQSAAAIAMLCRDHALAPPMRVVPDGDGGIILERWKGSLSTSIEVARDGTVEVVVVEDCRVVSRQVLSLE
ncbi:MAG: hypothetical protein HY287_09585 [Planctomycetes bacterium]|nr:hypothetical protein [Planctomycetota bacterium]